MPKGYYLGDVVAQWDTDCSHTMTLLKRFAFVDSQGHEWVADAGNWVDGASLRPALPFFRILGSILWAAVGGIIWVAIGTPFRGKYRRASVLHDVACQLRDKTGLPSWRTHDMFHQAMLADGVARWRAWLMWLAVRVFGPRW